MPKKSCGLSQRLATATGNAGWLTQHIVFNNLSVPVTTSGAMRWLPGEIEQGWHYDALLRHEHDRLQRRR